MRRGFSLVEAAIVLGVIGLVIGGIWVAANQVSSQHRITQISKGTLATAVNIRKLFPPASYPASSAQIYTGSLLNNLGVIPADWVNGSSSSIPGGGTASIGLFASGVVAGYGQTFRIMVTVKDARTANQLARSISGMGESFGLVLVQCYPTTSSAPLEQHYIPYTGFYNCPTLPGEDISVSAYFTP